ncbi:Sulfate permease 2 [Aspergillus wentii]|nr:Sulfate permease 2 [Aspergillus wentii]
MSKVGHGVAKVLGVKLADSVPYDNMPSYAYIEPEPTLADWFREHTPTSSQWFVGDLIAGVTVGAVVIPQGMAYANLAQLPAEYGLYSSFMGVLIYWFFATSKDITIGPVAVMSTLVGTIIIETQAKHPELDAPTIASALAIICGAITFFLGLIRFGFIVDFIPLPAITAFMTGSAINVCAGQVKSMLGETAGFSTRGATYKVIINTLKYLPTSQMDAAMGLTALAMLYSIRSACTFGSKRMSHKAKTFFFISTLRTVFVILFYTMISAAVNLHRRDDPAFKLLGNVPRGFKHAHVPKVNTEIISSFASELPAAVIVLVIEHIAISKCFGRVNNYTIDPSQEFVAIGVSNLLGPFLGGYPCTGSFSRTAIKAKAGVRTPLAGVITAVVVLLAIYALPALFFYIPKSSLSAVIIHAVGDLITPPSTAYHFWRVSPLDAIIFIAGVIITVFTSIEIGIYCTICVSIAILLFRIAKAQGQFLGQVKIQTIIGDYMNDEQKYRLQDIQFNQDEQSYRSIFLPVKHTDGSNPNIKMDQPSPGIFVYRLSDGFNYPNANHYTDHLVETIYQSTRRTNAFSYGSLGDRPWNDPGPRQRKGEVEDVSSKLPTLRAIILDFSSVNNVDVTCIQNLIDVRNQLDRHAHPEPVDWHFAHVNNRWTKRALVAAGFGFPSPRPDGQQWKSIFSVAEIAGSTIPDTADEARFNDVEGGYKKYPQTSEHERNESDASINRDRMTMVNGINRPLFHPDLASALHIATANRK